MKHAQRYGIRRGEAGRTDRAGGMGEAGRSDMVGGPPAPPSAGRGERGVAPLRTAVPCRYGVGDRQGERT